jgi:hypothetical protein
VAITNFIPEIWSAQLLSSLKKTLVFAGPTTVNRNYEGEIANAGDTVRITSISRPTIADYTKNVTAITPETSPTRSAPWSSTSASTSRSRSTTSTCGSPFRAAR